MRREESDVFLPQVDPRVSERLLPGPHPSWTAQGVIRALEPLCTEPRQARLRQVVASRLQSVTVLLDNPHDPHNGSAILRSCDAFGIQQLHVVCADEPFAASRLVAKGSQRWVDVMQHRSVASSIDHLKSEGYQMLVTHPEGKLTVADLPQLPRLALVLGNERDGVSPAFHEAASETVRVQMSGFVESLNVSVTAAILLHAATAGRSGDLSQQQADNLYARWLRQSVPRSDEVLAAFAPT